MSSTSILFVINFLFLSIHYSPIPVSGHAYREGKRVDESIFEADPGLRPEPRPAPEALVDNRDQQQEQEQEVKQPEKKVAYRCKKCRRVVALQENVVSHVPREGETCFDWNKRRYSRPFNPSDENECSSLFVEPMKWMTSGQRLSPRFQSCTTVIVVQVHLMLYNILSGFSSSKVMQSVLKMT